MRLACLRKYTQKWLELVASNWVSDKDKRLVSQRLQSGSCVDLRQLAGAWLPSPIQKLFVHASVCHAVLMACYVLACLVCVCKSSSKVLHPCPIRQITNCTFSCSCCSWNQTNPMHDVKILSSEMNPVELAISRSSWCHWGISRCTSCSFQIWYRHLRMLHSCNCRKICNRTSSSCCLIAAAALVALIWSVGLRHLKLLLWSIQLHNSFAEINFAAFYKFPLLLDNIILGCSNIIVLDNCMFLQILDIMGSCRPHVFGQLQLLLHIDHRLAVVHFTIPYWLFIAGVILWSVLSRTAVRQLWSFVVVDSLRLLDGAVVLIQIRIGWKLLLGAGGIWFCRTGRRGGASRLWGNKDLLCFQMDPPQQKRHNVSAMPGANRLAIGIRILDLQGFC